MIFNVCSTPTVSGCQEKSTAGSRCGYVAIDGPMDHADQSPPLVRPRTRQLYDVPAERVPAGGVYACEPVLAVLLTSGEPKFA